MLQAFGPVAAISRSSVVQLEQAGNPFALGTIIDTNGWTVTKASELVAGAIRGRLADGRIVEAAVLGSDEESDLALLQLKATGLTPITWATAGFTLGQWAVSPGIATLPEAVGIVSAVPRRIRARRAVIGVFPDFTTAAATVKEVMPGLGAERAGVQIGDVILAVNGAAVKNSEELVSRLRQFRNGQNVRLRIRRDEAEKELDVPMAIPKTRPMGRGSDRQDRMNRLGTELSRRAEGFPMALQHDSVLQPWQCGGPLVNLDGQALGVNIARAGRIASYALPVSLVREVIADLRAQAEDKKDGPAFR